MRAEALERRPRRAGVQTWLLLPGWSFAVETLVPLARLLPNAWLFDLEPLLGNLRGEAPGRRLDQIVFEAAHHLLEGRAVWVGWSLGGLVALRALELVPQRVQAVVLLASSPKFLAGENWPGIDRGAFWSLYRQVEKNPGRGVKRFEILVASQDRPLLRTLLRRPLWSKEALLSGLELLAEIDLRRVWRKHPNGVLFYAQRDALLPPSLATALKELNPRSNVLPFEGHHLFPLAHPRETATRLLELYGT